MDLPALLHRLKSLKWGAYSLISLYVSIASGIVVALQYDPATPFYSVSSLDLIVPFGEFFRSVHFYSSQLFFLFGCIHLIAVFESTEEYSTRDWVMLIISLPVALFLLFTGYVLRGDQTGYSAGMIAESILNTLPVIGYLLNDLLFDITRHGMKRVYIHHVISFDVLWLILVWDHLRKYRVQVRNHLPLLSITFGFCILVSAPLEPEQLGVTYISGPWFFLGLQELLRYFHPLIAGVIVPLLFLGALLLLRKESRWYTLLLRFIFFWLAMYLVLTIIAWLR